ncbi:hypothetical protein PMSD_19955 [Paenibacillus macquariensis subsp. defensor]|nr:hypothetical protein PMSD_19955 [Paenibacillus macquariensis subsp. defensor]
MNDDEELEKDNDYLMETLKHYQTIQPLNEPQERKIIKTAKFQANISTILVTLSILLLLAPVMTLGSYLYYAAGRANQLLDIVSKTIYVTEPNVKLESHGIDERIGIFSMDANFYTLKRIGKQDIRTGEHNVHFSMDQVSNVTHHNLLDTPVHDVFYNSETTGFIHPDEPSKILNQSREVEVLHGMTTGTVAELYISLNKTYSEEELKDAFPNIDIIWNAVDTGAPQKDDKGVFTAPIGYPVQPDKDPWSPFFIAPGDSKANKDIFIEIVKQLSENEHLATTVSRAKSLSLTKRLAYLEDNGIHVYGMVVTGPVDELKKLETNPMVRAIKVEDSRIWNWHS